MSNVDQRARPRTTPHEDWCPLDDPRVRACARHDLRHGADPVAVAALLEVCVEDLYDAIDYTPRRAA